jgi:arylsulfatase A-like enzyme
MKKLYESETFPLPNADKEFSDEEHQEVRRNYSAMVENIDRYVGLYLDLLEERGELENTLIIFSSDHGEMLGDHNGWSKSVPWHESASVPMVVSGPGVQKGTTCNLPTTNLDVTATFLDYAGLDIPDSMDSRSLKALLEGQTDTHRDVVLSGLNNWRLAYDGRFKYIEGYEDSPQFFDHETDLNENNNLINDANAAEDIERLKACLM